MPIPTVCPSCQTRYNLPDAMQGKQVRCKQCNNLFPVVSAALQRPSKILAPTKTKPSGPTPAEPPPSRKSSSRGLVLAVLLVIGLLGGGGGWFFVWGPGKSQFNKSEQVAKGDTAAELLNDLAKDIGKQLPADVPVPKVEDGKLIAPVLDKGLLAITLPDVSKVDPTKIDPTKIDPTKIVDPNKVDAAKLKNDLSKLDIPEFQPKDPSKPQEKASFKAIGAYSLAATPDGKTVALGDRGFLTETPFLSVYDVTTGALKYKVEGLRTLAISPDGKTLAAGDLGQGALKLFDLETGKEKASAKGIKAVRAAMNLAFSADGKLLASHNWESLTVWDADTLKPVMRLDKPYDLKKVFPDPVRNWVYLSPDGKTLIASAAIGKNSEVRLWDVPSGDLRKTLNVPSLTGISAISPDGKLLAVSEGNPTMTIWDLDSGTEVRKVPFTVKGFGRPLWGVTSLVFAPDGKTIAVAIGDDTIRLIQTADGKELGGFYLKGRLIAGGMLAFTADGNTLIAHSGDMRIWDMATASPDNFPNDPVQLASGTLRVAKSILVTENDPKLGKPAPTTAHSLALVGNDNVVLSAGLGTGSVRSWAAFRSEDAPSPFKAHDGPVTSMASAGGLTATGSTDGKVKVWEINIGRGNGQFTVGTKERMTLDTGGAVAAVSLTPDGKTLAAGGQTFGKVWDVASGKERCKLEPGGPVGAVLLSPDGKKVYCATPAEGVQTFDTELGAPGSVIPLGGRVRSMILTPDGKALIAGLEQTQVKVWDLQNGGEAATWKGHTAEVTALALSSDSRVAASGSRNGEVKLWALGTGKELISFSPQGPRPITALVFEQGVKKLWVAGQGGALTCHDLPDYAALPRGVPKATDPPATVVSNPATGKLILPPRSRPIFSIAGNPKDLLYRAAVSPDFKSVAASHTSESIRLVDIPSAQERTVFKAYENNGVADLAYPSDGGILASAGEAVKLFDPVTGKEITTLKSKAQPGNQAPRDSFVRMVRFSPDGTILASATQKAITLWDRAIGKEIAQLVPEPPDPTAQIFSMAFSRDGKTLAAGFHTSIIAFWDVPSGKFLKHISLPKGTEPSSIAFLADGKSLLVAGSVKVEIIDVQSGKVLRRIDAEGHVATLSPDQKLLVMGGQNGQAALWDFATGRRLADLKGLQGHIRCISFHPDGSSFIMVSDQTMIQFDIRERDPNFKIDLPKPPPTVTVAKMDSPKPDPTTKPEMPAKPEPATKPVGENLRPFLGTWTGSASGVTEIWTITEENGQLVMSSTYKRENEVVGNGVGKNIRIVQGQVIFTRSLDKKPAPGWADSMPLIIVPVGDQLKFSWGPGGRSGSALFTRTGGAPAPAVTMPAPVPPNPTPAPPKPAPTPSTDPFVGTWKWFRDAPVTVAANGTFLRNGKPAGTWKVIDARNRQYELRWSAPLTSVDVMTLSADGKNVDGKNQFGQRVTGTKTSD
jgi:predicted Zn finger-like uncharacterized protein